MQIYSKEHHTGTNKKLFMWSRPLHTAPSQRPQLTPPCSLHVSPSPLIFWKIVTTKIPLIRTIKKIETPQRLDPWEIKFVSEHMAPGKLLVSENAGPNFSKFLNP